MSDASVFLDGETPVSLERELAAYYAQLAQAVLQRAGATPSLAELRKAARDARLDQAPDIEGVQSQSIAGLGMPACLYRASSGRLPVLVYLHGGGWTMLGVDTHEALMKTYARQSRWAVLGLDYPLAPETQFPNILPACLHAVDALLHQAEAMQLDKSRVVIGGDSSGANLALAAALVLTQKGSPSIAGLMLNYGVFDHDMSRPSYRHFGQAPNLLTTDKMEFFWSNYCRSKVDREHPAASPLHSLPDQLSTLPQVHMTVAEQDVLFSENIAMYDKLKRAGVNAQIDIYRQAGHGFLEAIARSPVADQAVAAGANWLKQL